MNLASARKAWKASDEQIATNIRITQCGAGMTQIELADELGITDKTLRSWLKNPAKITFQAYRTIELIADRKGIVLKPVMYNRRIEK